MQHFPLYIKLFYLYLHGYLYLFEWAYHKTLLGYMVARACASPRNLIWFTGLFFLGWGLGTTLHEVWAQDNKMQALVQSNIEAWMVKPLSAGCINTAVAD